MAKQRNAKDSYDAGVKAKHQGFGRVTPYYEQPRADYWWLAGFDGVDFFEAESRQPEFFTGIPSKGFPPKPVEISPKQARELGMPIPQNVDRVLVPPELLPNGQR